MSDLPRKISSKSNVLQRNLCPDFANVIVAPCVVIMVGLPARGKTYMSKKLTRYLNWIGIDTKVFNVGEYRRRMTGSETVTADFFHPSNDDARRIREESAQAALADTVEWLREGGEVAVYDATNGSRERREWLLDALSQQNGFKVMFVESVCSDADIVDGNIR